MGLVIRGQVTFTVGDETRTFGPGGTWRVPSMTPHGALTGPDGATVVDVFNPIREDWHPAPIDELGYPLRNMLPNLRAFHVFEHSGHQVQNDEVEKFNQVVLDFLLAP